jgi:hypothetical protein
MEDALDGPVVMGGTGEGMSEGVGAEVEVEVAVGAIGVEVDMDGVVGEAVLPMPVDCGSSTFT